MKTQLVAVRLERTREVLRELLHSLRSAVPILMGVAGPIFIASLALLAWAGVPPMKAVTLPWRSGAALWLAQTAGVAWPLWALRARLLPEDWCVQLRCLPCSRGALLVSDLAVSAAVLAPLTLLYGLSAAAFAIHRTPWFISAWPAASASLAASWVVSCMLGAAALAWRRRGPVRSAVVALHAIAPAAVAVSGPRFDRAALWLPWWRGAMQPSGAAIVAGLLCVLALGLAWTRGTWPAVPGAAWALMTCGLLVALTERVQRAMERHLDALEPWLLALPAATGWRRHARILQAVPMIAGGLGLVAMAMLSRPWRGAPLACFAAGLAATPFAMGAVPSSNREAHVGLWAVCVGVLAAVGSELWN